MLAIQYQYAYWEEGPLTRFDPSSPVMPSTPSVTLFAVDSRLSFVFFSACSEIRVNSVTKDWPQKALELRLGSVEEMSLNDCIPGVLLYIFVELLKVH